MKMKLFVAALVVLSVTPIFAQERDMQITAYASQASIEGDQNFPDDFESEFEDGWGMGLSVNRYVAPMFSVEGSLFYLRNDASLVLPGSDLGIDLGGLNLMPISLGVQFHPFRRTFIDPYVGAGGSYVITRDLSSRDLVNAGVGTVELENVFTYYVNAGVGVQLGSALAVVLDGRYVPYETSSRSVVTGVEQDLDLTAQILSLGLRFKF